MQRFSSSAKKLILPIESVEALQLLRGHMPHDHVRLVLQGLSSEDSSYWEMNLNDLIDECGCTEAAIGMAVGAALTFAYMFLRPGGIGAWSTFDLIIGFIGFLVGTGIGKAIGLFRARTKFERCLDELTEHIHTNPTRAVHGMEDIQ